MRSRLQVARCGCESRDAGCRSRDAGREMRLQVASASCELRVASCDCQMSRDWGILLAYAYSVSMVYLCNSFVLSGIDFIFGMVLV